MKKPDWLVEWEQRTKFISILSLAYDLGCDCEVCDTLRRVGRDLSKLVKSSPPPIGNLTGVCRKSVRKKKRK